MLYLVEQIVGTIGWLAFLLYMLYEESWVYSATLAAVSWFRVGDGAWHHDPLGMAVSGVIAVLWTFIAWMDWKNRDKRRKRRAAELLGYKARALLAKLVSNMPAPRVPQRVPA